MPKKSNGNYQVTGVEPGLIHFLGRDWDLSQLTDEEAKTLLDAGCPYLVPAKETAASAAS